MFIVWGKKPVYHRLGYVAHFCPICRGPKPFEIKRVGSAGHLYYISFGSGKLLGYERTCQECGTVLQAEPADHVAIAQRLAPLPELIRNTFPQLEQVFAARLALEERIRFNPAALSADERQALIRSPFLLMSAKVDQRFARTHIDMGLGLAIAGAVAMTLFGPGMVQLVAPGAGGGKLVLVFLALGLAGIVWQAFAARPRFVRRAVLPVLARALRPLKPTQHELESIVSELGQLKHKMAKRIDVPALQAHMRPRAGSEGR
jgi:hypothetical protein